MGITKLSSFGGEAEVLGALHAVQWQGGALTIHGLVTPEEAYRILDALATKQLVAVRPPISEKGPPTTSTGVRGTPEENRASQATRSSKDRVPETQQPAPSNVVQLPKTEPNKLERIDRKDIAPPIITPTEDPALEFPPKTADTSPPFETQGELPAPGDVPEKVLKSGRFVEVMDWVMKSNGFKVTQVDEIVAACEKLRERIPAVQRVRDMKDKVVANLAAYTEAGAAGASGT